ncbi:MAG: intradiol ring-cleavage dioxygenase [Gammaproteobacteria bacterium]|nr:intradiol ring-cleavage dioxygenase [Gammaproteobacteria bacterium]
MAAAGFAPWQRLVAANELLPATPADAEGPFYPVELPPDSDNDLLRVAGMKDMSPGQQAYVHGTVVDRHGTPVDGAQVEIWQSDHGGVYHHPHDRGEADPRFQGFGATVTNRAGAYHFRTLHPVPYAGRTPHIHYRVSAPGFERLTTQLYVAGESDRNSRDFLYRRLTPDERALLTSAFRTMNDGGVAAEFNIVLT